jgi:hypothetical protein
MTARTVVQEVPQLGLDLVLDLGVGRLGRLEEGDRVVGQERRVGIRDRRELVDKVRLEPSVSVGSGKRDGPAMTGRRAEGRVGDARARR